MIELFYWTTPNGHKITMFLEEAGLPYQIRSVNIGTGEQFAPDFLRIAPNNRIPAIIDRAPAGGGEPVPVFESGAILLYLADKIGRFVPGDLRGRVECIQWLFWQMANLGPMAGQNHHFVHYAPEKIPYAIDRYVRETGRLYAVMNRRLAGCAWLAGDDYTIADMASYPWINPKRQSLDIDEFPELKRWREAIAARPATVRAYDLARRINTQPANATEESRRILFGQSKETVR